MTTHKSERLTEFYENFRTEGLNINYIRMDIKHPVSSDPPRTKEPPEGRGVEILKKLTLKLLFLM